MTNKAENVWKRFIESKPVWIFKWIAGKLASGILVLALLNVAGLSNLFGIEIFPRWDANVETLPITLDPKRVIGVPFELENTGNRKMRNVSGYCRLSFKAGSPIWMSVNGIRLALKPPQLSDFDPKSRESFECGDFRGDNEAFRLGEARLELIVTFDRGWSKKQSFYRQRFKGLIDSDGKAHFVKTGKPDIGRALNRLVIPTKGPFARSSSNRLPLGLDDLGQFAFECVRPKPTSEIDRRLFHVAVVHSRS